MNDILNRLIWINYILFPLAKGSLYIICLVLKFPTLSRFKINHACCERKTENRFWIIILKHYLWVIYIFKCHVPKLSTSMLFSFYTEWCHWNNLFLDELELDNVIKLAKRCWKKSCNLLKIKISCDFYLTKWP